MAKTNERISGELDLTSPKLNAEKALRESEQRVIIPIPSARVYDNISRFEVTEDGIFPKEDKPPSEKTSTFKTKPGSTIAPSSTADPPKGTKEFKNVISRMENLEQSQPLYFLKKCMHEALRVKITIRKVSTIRGFCIGYVEAFDKHMNIVLKDVFETWKRPRRKRPLMALGFATKTDDDEDDDAGEDESNLLISSGCTLLHKHGSKPEGVPPKSPPEVCYKIPGWNVKKRQKTHDLCERHIDQMMIRGEQIVFVTLVQT